MRSAAWPETRNVDEKTVIPAYACIARKSHAFFY